MRRSPVASGIYRGQPGGQEWKLVLEGVKGPASFTIDRKRKRLIVPVMEEDELRAYKLE
ncbi:MAG: hypothetical protein KIT84_13420 [Labilithrix sp.]|nr:hypothetical protein [Labilithrix sp.]